MPAAAAHARDGVSDRCRATAGSLMSAVARFRRMPRIPALAIASSWASVIVSSITATPRARLRLAHAVEGPRVVGAVHARLDDDHPLEAERRQRRRTSTTGAVSGVHAGGNGRVFLRIAEHVLVTIACAGRNVEAHFVSGYGAAADAVAAIPSSPATPTATPPLRASRLVNVRQYIFRTCGATRYILDVWRNTRCSDTR